MQVNLSQTKMTLAQSFLGAEKT